jgi:hypothetical protein
MGSFICGRYPHTTFYTFHTYMLISLVGYRFYSYKSQNYHYYMVDFCYFANVLILIFINYAPKNGALFKAFFMYANGPFGIAVPAFRNSLVFHRVDNMTSLFIHMIPLISSWTLRWFTMYHELPLPEEERTFVNFVGDSMD